MADIILTKLYKLPAIDWIGGDLVNESDSRKSYIQAMKAADRGDFSLLLKCIKNSL